jgi:tetratricopeptide (TPR) repeat protein
LPGALPAEESVSQKTLKTLVCGAILFLFLGGGECSRARVESLNAMNEGVTYAAQKRYTDAIDSLREASALDPTNDAAYWNMAIVHMEMQQYEAARDDLRRAIEINPESAGYHEKLGTVMIELEAWDDARAEFERAIELDANLFKAYFKLGQIFERLDDPQHALEQYTEAINRGPRFIEAYRALGRLYADLGYLAEAAQVLQSGLSVVIDGTSDEADLHHLLGTVYQQQQNYDAAVEEFRGALEIEPAMADALFSLGWTYGLQDNREEARRYLQRYIEVATGNAPAHYLKAAQDRLSDFTGP